MKEIVTIRMLIFLSTTYQHKAGNTIKLMMLKTILLILLLPCYAAYSQYAGLAGDKEFFMPEFSGTAINIAATPGKENPVMIGGTLLPNKVQHLNAIENYIVGNGIICASGTGNGQWDFIAGPDYTCPNFIENERLSMLVDGIEHELKLDMFRARETGVFYGTIKIGDLNITMIDYAVPGTSMVSRLVYLNNGSVKKKHTIQVKAFLTPAVFRGRNSSIIKGGNNNSSAALFKVDTSVYCMFGDDSKWVKNWADRFLLATWGRKQGRIKKVGVLYQISSSIIQIEPGKNENFNLCHYANFGNKPQSEYLKDINGQDGIADAEKSIIEWQKWFRNVPENCSLEKITDQKARDIAEGGLYVIKTNQTREGGIVANEKTYNLSWTRDAYCGLRGLLAYGHTAELRKFIAYMNGVYKAFGFIPNAVSCGSYSFALYNGNVENNPNRKMGQFSPCPESSSAPETPALLILVARDYYHASKDIQPLVEAEISLAYSMNIQLKEAISNNYKLEFSGDETELCGAVATDFAGFDRDLSKLWSMSSMALCIASLDFYMEYLALRNKDVTTYKNEIDGTILNLHNEKLKLVNAFESDFWRTDLTQHTDGFYDWCRIKHCDGFPQGRVVNFSLFPVYYKMNPALPKRFTATINTIKSYFNVTKNTIPLVPIIGDERFLGHNLGYLLWSLVETHDNLKTDVYSALVNGNTVQCWGSFNEAYEADGKPNHNNLRTFETGVNIDAIAKYWNIGNEN